MKNQDGQVEDFYIPVQSKSQINKKNHEPCFISYDSDAASIKRLFGLLGLPHPPQGQDYTTYPRLTVYPASSSISSIIRFFNGLTSLPLAEEQRLDNRILAKNCIDKGTKLSREIRFLRAEFYDRLLSQGPRRPLLLAKTFGRFL
jgi:hypothetical protein